MRQVLGHSLWIGHAGDLTDPRAILSQGIKAIIELADNEPMAMLPRVLIRCRFPTTDGDEERIWLLRLAAETTAALLRAQVPLIVCCSSGMSRSVCIAAAGLASANGMPLKEAISLVTEGGPADVSPALYERILTALRD